MTRFSLRFPQLLFSFVLTVLRALTNQFLSGVALLDTPQDNNPVTKTIRKRREARSVLKEHLSKCFVCQEPAHQDFNAARPTPTAFRA